MSDKPYPNLSLIAYRQSQIGRSSYVMPSQNDKDVGSAVLGKE